MPLHRVTREAQLTHLERPRIVAEGVVDLLGKSAVDGILSDWLMIQSNVQPIKGKAPNRGPVVDTAIRAGSRNRQGHATRSRRAGSNSGAESRHVQLIRLLSRTPPPPVSVTIEFGPEQGKPG